MEYKDRVLRIIYHPGNYENIFEFYGIEDWEEKEFMKKNPILIIKELYEESQDIFVYNTLWYYTDIEGGNYSEFSIKFMNLRQINGMIILMMKVLPKKELEGKMERLHVIIKKQNKQTDKVAKDLNLTKKQRQELHRLIGHMGLGYKQVLRLAKQ